MGVHPSQISEQPAEPVKPDYTLPIGKPGEQQFALIQRNRSGFDAGEIDFGLRDCTILCEAEQQDIVDIAFALYQSICRQVGKRAANDNASLQVIKTRIASSPIGFAT